jgi:hypothetical protein
MHLYKTAFEDDPLNEFFVLLSDKCIPLYNFHEIHNKFMKANKSIISFHSVFTRQSLLRLRTIKYPNFFNKLQYGKQHQWMMLNRSTVLFFINNNFYNVYGNNSVVPDEHYFVNICNKYHKPFLNRQITFVNWDESDMFRMHPKTYNQLPDMLINNIRRLSSSLFMRKVSKKCCLSNKYLESISSKPVQKKSVPHLILKQKDNIPISIQTPADNIPISIQIPEDNISIQTQTDNISIQTPEDNISIQKENNHKIVYTVNRKQAESFAKIKKENRINFNKQTQIQNTQTQNTQMQNTQMQNTQNTKIENKQIQSMQRQPQLSQGIYNYTSSTQSSFSNNPKIRIINQRVRRYDNDNNELEDKYSYIVKKNVNMFYPGTYKISNSNSIRRRMQTTANRYQQRNLNRRLQRY